MSVALLMRGALIGFRFGGMDRDEALSQLPGLYGRALRLREQGCDRAQIAVELDVPAEAVGMLLRVAEAKLARLIGPD